MTKSNVVKFSGNRYCGKGDKTFLVSHMISQDYVLEDQVALLVRPNHGKSPQCKVWWPLALW